MSDEAAASDAAPHSAAPSAPASSNTPSPATAAAKKRRRGSRGGRNRPRARPDGDASETDEVDDADDIDDLLSPILDDDRNPELPDPPAEGRVQSPEAAEQALVRRPRIGDTRPAPVERAALAPESLVGGDDGKRRRRTRGGRGRAGKPAGRPALDVAIDEEMAERRRGRERKGRPIGRYMMCVHVRP
ncbi:MAG: ribonuclease, partial [Acidimicrobiaceae bacterium]|nr:ribonuclease [Acidimicrobiaceae bacterium]